VAVHFGVDDGEILDHLAAGVDGPEPGAAAADALPSDVPSYLICHLAG
jgi:hypothetical protein